MSLFSDHPGLKRVPDFVGLDFAAAQALTRSSGWGLRGTDPDAAPMSNHWGDHQQLVVAAQDPAAGGLLLRNERIAVVLAEPPAA